MTAWRPASTLDTLAFTRVELLALLAVVSLLAATVLPTLAGTRQRADRLVCLNNLRQIGQAMRSWGEQHGNLPPSGCPVDQGGLERAPQAANVFIQFGVLSNELKSAMLLACPADPWVKPAADFQQFFHMSWRNAAVSYFQTLDTWLEVGDSPWAGDRNVNPSARQTGCSRLALGGAASGSFIRGDPNLVWTNAVHGMGNLLLPDGSAHATPSQDLSTLLPAEPNGVIHFLAPH